MYGGKFGFQNRLGWLVVGSPTPRERGGLYSEERFNGGSSALRFWGLIFGGAYFWNFTVPRQTYD